MLSLSYKTIQTPLNGLKIHLNKVIGDDRGYFCDLAEADNPLFKDGCVHLHTAIAVKKGVARGEHYHYRVKENFYILSGTALFLFSDFNKKSKTYGKTHAVILGFSSKKIDTKKTKSYFIDKGKFAQIEVSPYIYHAFWPLTNDQVVCCTTGTRGYDPADYVRPSIEEVPGASRILKKHAI